MEVVTLSPNGNARKAGGDCKLKVEAWCRDMKNSRKRYRSQACHGKKGQYTNLKCGNLKRSKSVVRLTIKAGEKRVVWSTCHSTVLNKDRIMYMKVKKGPQTLEYEYEKKNTNHLIGFGKMYNCKQVGWDDDLDDFGWDDDFD